MMSPLYVQFLRLVIKDVPKALEASLDCVATTTSYLPMLNSLDYDVMCACVSLTQKGDTNVGNFSFLS